MYSIVYGQRGFTLIELMISLVIFSILSTMAYTGLQSVLVANEHTTAAAKRLVKLQTAFAFLQRDIEQALSRRARDSFGDSRAGLSAGTFGGTLLELTRGGWRNPTGSRRSRLQRVAYRLEEQTLARLTWPMVDQPPNSEPFVRTLLDNVTSVELRFLDAALQWQNQWPVSDDDEEPNQMPRAVEFTVEYRDMGPIKRIFRVPPGESVIPQRQAGNAGGNAGNNASNNQP